MRIPRPLLVALLATAAAFASTPVSVWPVDSLIKVFQDDPPDKNRAPDKPCLVARHGHASLQIAIRASAPVPELTVDVKLAGGLQTQVRRVGYVPVRSNPPGTPADEVVRAAPARFPDPLFEETPFALAANQTAAVWITIYAPAETAPGMYKGEAVFRAGRKQLARVPFQMRVSRATVPAKQTLRSPTGSISTKRNSDVITIWPATPNGIGRYSATSGGCWPNISRTSSSHRSCRSPNRS